MDNYSGTTYHNYLPKRLLEHFRIPFHIAPGEAEAECAALQQSRIVDAVMSEDIDALMFGSSTILKDWSSEGTRGNKSPTHVNVLKAEEVQTDTGLDRNGMILVALLSGGDYNTEGVRGFGKSVACEAAKAGFGEDLIEAVRQADNEALRDWRERLQAELEDNVSGYFKTKHKTLKLPENFPDRRVLSLYTNPEVSSPEAIQTLRQSLTWDEDIDILSLRAFVAEHFEWEYRSGARKFIRSFAPAYLSQQLRCLWDKGLRFSDLVPSQQGAASIVIRDRRSHFDNDGMPELRVEYVPLDLVKLDLDAEETNPYYENLAKEKDAQALELGEFSEEDAVDLAGEQELDMSQVPVSPRKVRKTPIYDPRQPERIWIIETIAKLGLQREVEEWEEKQREVVNSPKKYISRKVASKPKVQDAGMREGALNPFFRISKSTIGVTSSSKTPKHTDKPTAGSRNAISAQANPNSTKSTKKSGRRTRDESPKLDHNVNPFSIAIKAKNTFGLIQHARTLDSTLISSNGIETNPRDSVVPKVSTQETILLNSSPIPSSALPDPSATFRRKLQTPPPTQPARADINSSPDSLPSPSILLRSSQPTQISRSATASFSSTSTSFTTTSFAPTTASFATASQSQAPSRRNHHQGKEKIAVMNKVPGERQKAHVASLKAGPTKTTRISDISLVDLTTP